MEGYVPFLNLNRRGLSAFIHGHQQHHDALEMSFAREVGIEGINLVEDGQA